MPSGLVGQHPTNDLPVGFPPRCAEHPWTLEFKQYSLHPIRQVLQRPLDIAYLVATPRYSPAVCPLGLSALFR
jgi:hypothetical protein